MPNSFVIFSNVVNSTFEQCKKKIELLKKNNWVDNRTICIYADFVLYNPYLEFFTYVQPELQFEVTGKANAELQLFNIRYSYYKLNFFDILRAICEAIFLVCTLLYIWLQVKAIKLMYHVVNYEIAEERNWELVKKNEEEKLTQQKQLTFLRRTDPHLRSPTNIKIANKEKKKCNNPKCRRKIWEYFKMVGLILWKYIHKYWTILDLINIILCIFIISFYLCFIINYESVILIDSTIFNFTLNDLFEKATYFLYQLKLTCGFASILQFLRLLRFFSILSENIRSYLITIKSAISSMGYYLVIFSILLLSVCLLLHTYFGSDFYDFSTVFNSLMSSILILHKKFDRLNNVLENSILFSVAFFSIYMITMSFCLVYLFLGIIKYEFQSLYSITQSEHAMRQISGSKPSESITDHKKDDLAENKIQVHYFISIKRHIILLLSKCGCKYWKKKLDENIREEKKYIEKLTLLHKAYYHKKKTLESEQDLQNYSESNLIKHQKITSKTASRKDEFLYSSIQSAKYDSNYPTHYSRFSTPNNNVLQLTSLNFEDQQILQKEKSYGRFLYIKTALLAFMAIFFVIIWLQLRIYTGFKASSRSNNILTKELYYTMKSSGLPYNFSDITDLEHTAEWIRQIVPKYVSITQSQKFKFIIGGEIRISFRLGKCLAITNNTENKTYRYVTVCDRFPIDKEITNRKLETERTDSFIGKESKMKYEYLENSGYLSTGAYVFYWKLNSSTIDNNVNKFLKDGIIGPDMWVLAIDYAIYDPITNTYIFDALVITFYNTGEIAHLTESYPIVINDYNNTLVDYLKGFTEAILLLVIIIKFITFVIRVYRRYKKYSSWIKSAMVKLSDIERYLRRMKKMEWLRKFEYIFPLFRIIEALALILGIVWGILYIVIIVKDKSFSDAIHSVGNENNSNDFCHDKFNYQDALISLLKLRTHYINIVSVIIILLCILVLEKVHHFKQLKKLFYALAQVSIHLPSFTVLLMSLLLGFSIMAYVCYGDSSLAYSTYFRSFVNSMLLIKCDFVIEDFTKKYYFAGSLYFIIFLVIFVHIIQNLFISIVTEKIKESNLLNTRRPRRLRKRNMLCWCKLKIADEENNTNEIMNNDFKILHQGKKVVASIVTKANGKKTEEYNKYIVYDYVNQIIQELTFRTTMRNYLNRMLKISLGNKTKKDASKTRLYSDRAEAFHLLRLENQLIQFTNEAICKNIEDVNSAIMQISQQTQRIETMITQKKRQLTEMRNNLDNSRRIFSSPQENEMRNFRLFETSFGEISSEENN